MQNRVIDDCLQLHGGYGYMWEYPVARAWADARAQRIYGGANEIMLELIARTLDCSSSDRFIFGALGREIHSELYRWAHLKASGYWRSAESVRHRSVAWCLRTWVRKSCASSALVLTCWNPRSRIHCCAVAVRSR